MNSINWRITEEDTTLIGGIVDRAEGAGLVADRMASVMDITAVHSNGCPLKLAELLSGADFDFMHDFTGIARHIDRTTGKPDDCFLPRFAEVQA